MQSSGEEALPLRRRQLRSPQPLPRVARLLELVKPPRVRAEVLPRLVQPPKHPPHLEGLACRLGLVRFLPALGVLVAQDVQLVLPELQLPVGPQPFAGAGVPGCVVAGLAALSRHRPPALLLALGLIVRAIFGGVVGPEHALAAAALCCGLDFGEGGRDDFGLAEPVLLELLPEEHLVLAIQERPLAVLLDAPDYLRKADRRSRALPARCLASKSFHLVLQLQALPARLLHAAEESRKYQGWPRFLIFPFSNMLMEEFLQMKLASLALGKMKEARLGSTAFSPRIVASLSSLALAERQLKDCIVCVYLLAVALCGLQEGVFLWTLLVELDLLWLSLEKPAEDSLSLLDWSLDKVRMLLLVMLADFLSGWLLLRISEAQGLDHFCYCCLQDSLIFPGVPSVWVALLAVSGLLFLRRKELGMSARMLLGRLECTCARSITCICRSDLTGHFTSSRFTTFFTAFALLAGGPLEYSSLTYSFSPSFSLSQHYQGLDSEPEFAFSPREMSSMLFLSSCRHFLQRAISLLSGFESQSCFPLSQLQMPLPSTAPSCLQSSTVKCLFSLSLPQQPKKEASKVKTLLHLKARPNCTRAVLRLSSSEVKVQSSNLMQLGLSLAQIRGNILASMGLAGLGLPQKKLNILRLWPCRSSMKAISLPLLTSAIYRLMNAASCRFLLFEPSHLLLRSRPAKLVLQLPAHTPSGLIIGSTFISQCFRRNSASLSLLSRKSMSPSQMKEPGVSPGCWRAMTTIIGLALAFGLPSLMVTASILFLPIVFWMVSLSKSSCLYLTRSTLSRYSLRSAQVQGKLCATLSTSFSCAVETVKVSVQQKRLEFSTWCSLRQYLTSFPPLNQPFLVLLSSCSEWRQGSMPQLNSESGLRRLTMLSLMAVFLGGWLRRKQNHCVLPLVLRSFCSSRSNSLAATLQADSRLPDSKSESKLQAFGASSGGCCGQYCVSCLSRRAVLAKVEAKYCRLPTQLVPKLQSLRQTSSLSLQWLPSEENCSSSSSERSSMLLQASSSQLASSVLRTRCSS